MGLPGRVPAVQVSISMLPVAIMAVTPALFLLHAPASAPVFPPVNLPFLASAAAPTPMSIPLPAQHVPADM